MARGCIEVTLTFKNVYNVTNAPHFSDSRLRAEMLEICRDMLEDVRREAMF